VELGVVADGVACLCVHCVHADDVDVGLLRALGATIALCPRSNRAHAHGTAPLARFRAAGIPTGLGTDSIVSTGDLALWPEATAAGQSGEEALRLLTYEGARALGWDSEIGSLEVGKQADIAVFASTALDRPRPPSTALLTVVAGRVVHR
jgi:5-methylthioadenosine/S-adenosylhomocysteine deaminase